MFGDRSGRIAITCNARVKSFIVDTDVCQINIRQLHPFSCCLILLLTSMVLDINRKCENDLFLNLLGYVILKQHKNDLFPDEIVTQQALSYVLFAITMETELCFSTIEVKKL